LQIKNRIDRQYHIRGDEKTNNNICYAASISTRQRQGQNKKERKENKTKQNKNKNHGSTYTAVI